MKDFLTKPLTFVIVVIMTIVGVRLFDMSTAHAAKLSSANQALVDQYVAQSVPPAGNCDVASNNCSAASFTTPGAISGATLALSSTVNPLQLPTNGELCFDGATCSQKIVYDGSNLTFFGGFNFQNSGSFNSSNLTAIGSTATSTGTGGYTANTTTGNNAFVIATAGARLKFSGASTYFDDDGTNIRNASVVGTPASGTGITANYSGKLATWVHKVTVTNTAMTASPTTDVNIHVTPVNSRIIRVLDEVGTVFSGGALSAVTVTCGKTAGGNEYLLSHSVLAATGAFGDVAAEVGAGLLTATWADFGTVASGVPGAITVQCRFTCTGANCNAATQGSAVFYVEGQTY